jgi:eukaryotic translation initiation factor 2C
MIKISAIKPPERARGVMKWREELAYEKQKKIDAWGLEVGIEEELS